jgi:hypothetical protein
MAKNRADYNKSMQILIKGISIYICYLLSFLFFGMIDNIFFGSELSVYLSNRYFRYMTGFITISALGGGAFLMYWGTRVNNSFIYGFDEKLDLPTKAKTENHSTVSIEKKAKDFALSDSSFSQLLKRFYGYLRGISGSGQFGLRQALDLYADGKNYMVYYFILCIAILPFLIFYVSTTSYIESFYQAKFNDVMKSARLARPELITGVIALIVILMIYVIFKYVRIFSGKILGSIMRIGDKVLSTDNINPWDENFKYFMNEKHQRLIMPWRAYFYPLLIFCAVLPMSLGAVLLNQTLILWGGCTFIIGNLLQRFDKGKGLWFQFKDPKNLIIGDRFKKTSINIYELDEVIVHYQSIQNSSTRISSESAMMRSLGNNILSELLDSPTLIPSTITFFIKSGEAYFFPLRYVERPDEGVTSHELEFFFAFWIKSNGFTFELAASNEDAGDWRAIAPK